MVVAVPLLVAVALTLPGTASGGTPTTDAEAARAATLINAFRVSHGRRPVRVSRTLGRQAVWYARDMAARDGFDPFHVDSLGRRSWDRARAFGYVLPDEVAEISATGYPDAARTVRQWRSSRGHRTVLLDPTLRWGGVARATNPATSGLHFWAAAFGPVGDGPPQGRIGITVPVPSASATTIALVSRVPRAR